MGRADAAAKWRGNRARRRNRATIGLRLGCDSLDILVSPNGLLVTTISGGEFRTRLRRVVHFGVNMAVLDQISLLSHRLQREA